MNGLDLFLITCASIGGVIFVIRMIMMFGGMDSDVDFDMSDGDLGDTGDAFVIFSINTISAFLLMFGLGGLTGLKQFEWGQTGALIFGFGCGCFIVWVINVVMKKMKKLQEDGTMNLNQAIGQEATVYLTIKPGEKGKVQMAVNSALQTFDAVSDCEKPISTGTRVKVINVGTDRSLTVQTIEKGV